jgi:osmotically-inducible protein OsmY
MTYSFYFALGVGLSLSMPIYAQAPGTSSGGTTVDQRAAKQSGSTALKDPIELCQKLAGVERQLCEQKARENRERAGEPALGATPGDSGTRKAGEAPGTGTTPETSR